MMYSNADTLQLNDSLKHFLIVDAVRAPDIKALAYRHEAEPDLTLLYADSPLEHLAQASPVIVTFTGASPLIAFLEEDFALRSSCIIASFMASNSDDDILTHLRNLMIVKIKNNLTLFRFYSAAFWEQVKNDIQQQDIHTILGPLSQLSWCSDDKSWHTFQHEPEALAPSPFQLTSTIIAEQV